MRLGVKDGEINVLYRKAGKPEMKCACLTMVLTVAGSLLGTEPIFSSESPLEHCRILLTNERVKHLEMP